MVFLISYVLAHSYMVAGIFLLVYPQKYVLATCFSGIDIVDTKGFAIPTVETGGLRSPLNPTICQQIRADYIPVNLLISCSTIRVILYHPNAGNVISTRMARYLLLTNRGVKG